MIRKHRHGSGLRGMLPYIPFIDTDTYSKNYFRISDFPETFSLGINSFRIVGNSDALVDGSIILIDVVDGGGGVVYHEVVDYIRSDQSRVISVYIYPETPPGELTVYIAGRVRNDPITGNPISTVDELGEITVSDVPNLIWVGRSTVDTSRVTESDIIYAVEPTIRIREVKHNVLTPVSGSRLITTSGSSGLSTLGRYSPRQLVSSPFNTGVGDNPKRIIPVPIVDGEYITSRPSVELARYSGLPTVVTSNPFFKESMVGGKLTVRNIDISTQYSGASDIGDYTFNIVDVVNSRIVNVDRPFQYTLDGLVIDRFTDQLNWEIQYYDSGIELSDTGVTDSYLEVECTDLQPMTGYVNKIALSYKPIGSMGEFVDLGRYDVLSTNLLVDKSVHELDSVHGMIDKRIGYPTGVGDVNAYWVFTSSGDASIITFGYSNDYVLGGIQCTWDDVKGESYTLLTINDDYKISVYAGSAYIMSYDIGYRAGTGTTGDGVLDVYISGSSIWTDVEKIQRNDIINASTLGTYVGSVSSGRGRVQRIMVEFESLNDGHIKPIFVFRRGSFDIGRIAIDTGHYNGFTANHAKFQFPMSSFVKSNDVILDFKYVGNNDRVGNLNTRIMGLYVSGSDSGVRFLDIAPSGIISSSNFQYEDSPVSKLSIRDGGQYTLYTATNAYSGSPAHGANGSINRSVHGGYLGTVNTFGAVYQLKIPLFTRTDDVRVPYTGDDLVGGMYEIHMTLFISSGSVTSPLGVYTWGAHTRGRFYIPNLSGSTHVGIYDAAVSSVSFIDDGYSTFGKAGIGILNPLFEAGYEISSTHSLYSESLWIPHRIKNGVIPAPSVYDVYYVATCTVTKFELLN